MCFALYLGKYRSEINENKTQVSEQCPVFIKFPFWRCQVLEKDRIPHIDKFLEPAHQIPEPVPEMGGAQVSGPNRGWS